MSDGALVRVEAADTDGRDPILLGLEDGVGVFGLDLDALPDAERSRLLERGRLIGLREAGDELGRAEAGLAAYVTALLNWHRRHRFCANCGMAHRRWRRRGTLRRCPTAARSFPAHRSGRDHDRRARGAAPVGAPERMARRALLGACRVHLARRVGGGGGRARGARGIGHRRA